MLSFFPGLSFNEPLKRTIEIDSDYKLLIKVIA